MSFASLLKPPFVTNIHHSLHDWLVGLSDIFTMRTALSCIDSVVVIWIDFCGPVTRAEQKLTYLLCRLDKELLTVLQKHSNMRGKQKDMKKKHKSYDNNKNNQNNVDVDDDDTLLKYISPYTSL